jgi:hypothetical protein
MSKIYQNLDVSRHDIRQIFDVLLGTEGVPYFTDVSSSFFSYLIRRANILCLFDIMYRYAVFNLTTSIATV